MRFGTLVLLFLVTAGPAELTGQLSDSELRARVAAVDAESGPLVLLRAASAARLLSDYATAEELLERGDDAVRQAEMALVNERILFALASGQGANGMQRALRDARSRIQLSPQEVAGLANNYPSLLLGGELDEMILSFSLDAADEEFRCPCLAQKAWVHRVAGRLHESRILWGELVSSWDRNPLSFDNPDAQADWQSQYARNLARAGRTTDARAALAKARSMPVSEEALPSVQRRWAQALVELGDVAGALELLEPLIESSTLVTVNSLSTRYTWEPVRDRIEFQEMLARHR